MTVAEQLPVLTVTGTCGNTMLYNIDGKLVAFSCNHHINPISPKGSSGDDMFVQDTSSSLPPEKPYVSLREFLHTGHGGGAAMEVVSTINDLAREGLSDDHILILKPDGSVGSDPDDYHRLLDSSWPQGSSEVEPIQVDLGDRVRSFMSDDLDKNARPFVLVCPPSFGAIGVSHLEPALRAAAEVNAPVRLVTL
jgi:hypothetical protein